MRAHTILTKSFKKESLYFFPNIWPLEMVNPDNHYQVVSFWQYILLRSLNFLKLCFHIIGTNKIVSIAFAVHWASNLPLPKGEGHLQNTTFLNCTFLVKENFNVIPISFISYFVKNITHNLMTFKIQLFPRSCSLFRYED